MNSDQERLNDRVRDTIRGLSDEALERVAENSTEYTGFALETAHEELLRRGSLGKINRHTAALEFVERPDREPISAPVNWLPDALVAGLPALFFLLNVVQWYRNGLPASSFVVANLSLIAILLISLPLVYHALAYSIKVAADSRFLYVADSKKEIRIPLSQIASVEERAGHRGPESATVFFHSTTEVGDKISFLLPTRNVRLGNHPAAELLRIRIGQDAS